MKKMATLLLAALLCMSLAHAEENLMDPEMLPTLVSVTYEDHATRHTLENLLFEDATMRVEVVCPTGTPEGLLACVDYADSVARPRPQTPEEVNALFMELFTSAQSISEGLEGVSPLNLARFEGEYDSRVAIAIASSDWWQARESPDMDMLVLPVMLTDAAGGVIDNDVYVLCIFTQESGTRAWLCADDELTFVLLSALLPEDGGETGTPFLVEWMHAFAMANLAEELLDGTVTVTNHRKVNLREAPSTDAKVVGQADPGDMLPCFAAVGEDWYRVEYKGKTAYVGTSLVEYEANP